MNLLEELKNQFPELAVSFKGDDLLLRVKDINEHDQMFPIGSVDDIVLYFLMPLSHDLRVKIEAYVKKIRPTVRRIIFCY